MDSTVLVSWGVGHHFMDQDPAADIWEVWIVLPQLFYQTVKYTEVHASSQIRIAAHLQGLLSRFIAHRATRMLIKSH